MSTHEKDTFLATYQWAGDWESLPWSHKEPTLFLAEICRRRPPGRALDIGCGAGTDSVFLAQQGWEVTSLDFVPQALEYTRSRASEAGVAVTTVEADITVWQPPHSYDLVLDHGLLHNMDPDRHAMYRATVMAALDAAGDFVLLHWHPRYSGQPDGKMGPHRADRDEIKTFFAPELQERFFAREEFEDLTTVVGGGMVQAYYWFRPNQAWRQPQALVEQITRTLESNGIEWQKMLAAMGSTPPADVSESQLCTLLGPGRFGICHRQPEAEELESLVRDFATRAAMKPERFLQLLWLFASPSHADICVMNARCELCSVIYCKRLRDR